MSWKLDYFQGPRRTIPIDAQHVLGSRQRHTSAKRRHLSNKRLKTMHIIYTYIDILCST